jgi:Rad3-related DNA helicase
MAEAVAKTLASGRHLVAQAGTGTGKSLAYLVPAILSGKRVVVATATKALQDQLADKDLPFLRRAMRRDFSFAVLKGRSNYLCVQRATEVVAGGDQPTLGDLGEATWNGDREEGPEGRRQARRTSTRAPLSAMRFAAWSSGVPGPRPAIGLSSTSSRARERGRS